MLPGIRSFAVAMHLEIHRVYEIILIGYYISVLEIFNRIFIIKNNKIANAIIAEMMGQII